MPDQPVTPTQPAAIPTDKEQSPTTPQEPIPQSPPDQPAPEVKQKPSKLPFILIVLLAVAIGLAGFFGYKYFQSNQQPITDEQPIPAVTPTPDPTAGWSTYTNTAHGYSIKFPSSWRTLLVAAGAGDKEALPNSGHVNLFDTNIKTNDSSTGASKGVITIQYFDLFPEQFANTPFDDQIGNVEAIKNENVYYVKTNGGILEILVVLPENQKDESVFDQILSTFQFTN